MAEIEAILKEKAKGLSQVQIAQVLDSTLGSVAGKIKRHNDKQKTAPGPEKILRLEQWQGVSAKPQLGEFNEALAKLERDKRYVVVEHDNDNHFPYQDSDAQELRSAIRQILQPDLIVVGSDAGDFPGISRFEKDRRIPTGRVLSRFREHWLPHIDRLSYDAPKSLKAWIDGNHDERAWLAIEADENYDILMDYHTNTIKADNRVFWRGTGNASLSVIVGKALVVTHGTKATTHTAAATLDEFDRQYSVMAGHSHRPDYYTRGVKYKVTAIIGGCGCQLMPHYERRNVFSKWQHGYQYAVVDTLTETAYLQLVEFHHSEGKLSAYLNGEIISVGKADVLEGIA